MALGLGKTRLRNGFSTCAEVSATISITCGTWDAQRSGQSARLETLAPSRPSPMATPKYQGDDTIVSSGLHKLGRICGWWFSAESTSWPSIAGHQQLPPPQTWRCQLQVHCLVQVHCRVDKPHSPEPFQNAAPRTRTSSNGERTMWPWWDRKAAVMIVVYKYEIAITPSLVATLLEDKLVLFTDGIGQASLSS